MNTKENFCMTTAEVAQFLQISERTLKKMRTDGTGPQFFKFGRLIRYSVVDILAWRDSMRHNG